MKLFNNIALSIAALAFANTTYAAPVQYQFTGTHVYEINGNLSALGDTSQYLIADGTTLSISFLYNSDIPARTANLNSFLLGTFLADVYDNAITEVSGATAGQTFSAVSGSVIVDTAGGGIFNVAGEGKLFDNFSGSQFQGFSIDDFTLIGFQWAELTTSTSTDYSHLPSPDKTDLMFMLLTFVDSNKTVRQVEFSGTITPVPVPAAGLLFGSGLMGLIAGARRKIKKS